MKGGDTNISYNKAKEIIRKHNEASKEWYNKTGKDQRITKGIIQGDGGLFYMYRCPLCGFSRSKLEQFELRELEIIKKKSLGRLGTEVIGTDRPSKEYIKKIKEICEEILEILK